MGAKEFRTSCAVKTMLLLALLPACVWGCSGADVHLDQIILPPGFSIEVLVDNVPNARAMAFGDNGTLFVGSRDKGNVYAVEYRGHPRPKVHTILKDLQRPTGIAFRDGALYVAEVHQILRFDDIEHNLRRVSEPVSVTQLPADRQHGWRYLAFGPDDKLYVPVGARCDVCPEEEGYAVIMRMNADGSEREVYARGIRNSVGFTWHPVTGALVFTDNGRDHLGDDVPLCELNMATAPGQHFGFPFCHSGTIADPEFGHLGDCGDVVPPLQNLGPHVAPLGVKFYTGTQFPAAFRGDVYIAEHGSWNRSQAIGYRISRVRMDGDKALAYEVFAQGWLQGQQAWGRPADILLEPGGSMLVSDDLAGVIYRIRYNADKSG